MKLSMTFEDQPDGNVKIVSTPPANELFAKFKNGHYLTPAEAMVVQCCLRVLSESKRANYKERKIEIFS